MLKRTLTAFAVALLVSGRLALPLAWAAEDTTEGDAGDEQSESASASEKAGTAKRKTKGKRGREKETEGTQAPDRFQAETVIKSKYRLNGEPLEVDPD